MYEYIAKIQHDKGSFKLHTYASSYEAALHIITSAERCPESAIQSLGLSAKGKIKKLIDLIKSSGAENLEIKERAKSVTVIAPYHSYHTSIFDKAYRLCQDVNIQIETKSIAPYTLKFSVK